ncbi:MAG: type I-B CRISPR-associated protein Cas8b1/Cst1 [Methanosphaera stadtmanae]|nr:type I-B CRISPR-associated protein Cas8b1/Cst1 [Methanosphaera stadtmanae]
MSEKLDLHITGNPFIDSGIYALNMLVCKETKINDMTFNHLHEGIKLISELYLTPAWNKNMFSIFPNSILTNNVYKDKKQELYPEELDKLFNSINDTTDNGTCIGCGRRDSIKEHVKRDVPLTGSVSFKNFFSYAKEGADYCPLCVLLIQFMPLVLYRSGGKFILFHSDSEKVMKYWSIESIKNYNKQVSSGDYVGCFNEEYQNPVNGIFHIIEKMIKTYDRKHWDNINPSLNFYYFTNYNQGAELDLYSFPNNVFNFLTYIPSTEENNWKYIIRRQYVNIKKDEEEEKYKNKKNRIYENLLNGKSILHYLFDVKNKKTFCSWELLKYYLGEVENMSDNRIEAIRKLGDSLSEYIVKYDDKKVLTDIEQASTYGNFTNILRKIMKSKVEKGDKELLCTFDDFVNYICPDYKVWKETRDLILFRLYENLSEWLIDNK